MRYQAAAGAAIIAGASFMQSCPAPVAAFIPLMISVAGDLAGALVNILGKRSLQLGPRGELEMSVEFNKAGLEKRQEACFSVPDGVPENVVTDCCNALPGRTITVSGQNAEGGITMDGLPFECISVAPWIDGTGAVPFACGDECLRWSPLTQQEYNDLRDAFLSRFPQ